MYCGTGRCRILGARCGNRERVFILVVHCMKGTRSARTGVGGIMANPYALLTFAALCWSGNHVVGRAIGGHVPPLGVSTMRWLIPALVLWPIAQPHLQRDWPAIKAQWPIMLWLGITGGAAFS